MPPEKITRKKKLSYALAAITLVGSGYCFAPSSFTSETENSSKHSAPLDNKWQRISIKSGDSLARLLQTKHLAASDLSQLDKHSHTLLSRLKPGEAVEVIPENGHITWLRYHPSKTTVLLVRRQGSKLIGSVSKIPMAYNLNFKTIKVKRNLSTSEHAANFSATMANDVEHMFAGSVNLNRSLHRGDTLDVLYEEYYLKGVLHHTGHVLAATLHNQNKSYNAYQYKTAHRAPGFYKENGRSVDPLFLSFPLKFKRISSKFNLHRLDPVTHRIAPHVGIDLAARSGTPVRSIGNGRIAYVGWIHGYGNTVKINYGGHRQSLYGHLSKYKHGVHAGQTVSKGDVVGFVGQTGWATGPHLHFGFYLHKHPVNWLKYKKPVAPSIPRAQLAQFHRFTHELKSQLALYHDVQLAKSSLNVNKKQG